MLWSETGCTRWFQLTDPPQNAQHLLPAGLAAAERIPVIVSGIRLTSNGAVLETTPQLERRVLALLNQTGIFSQLTLLGYGDSPAGKHVSARLSILERIDPHPGDAAWKGLVIGASLFLLTPLLPLEYDYASEMTLEIERWDGQVKRYTASSKGTAYYHLFGATPLASIELKGQVTERCLTSMMAQLVNDAAFFTKSLYVSLPSLENPHDSAMNVRPSSKSVHRSYSTRK